MNASDFGLSVNAQGKMELPQESVNDPTTYQAESSTLRLIEKVSRRASEKKTLEELQKAVIPKT